MPCSSCPSAFTTAERVALDAARDERPETLAVLEKRLAPVVEELSQPCQGWVVTEREADDLLDRLRDEFVGRMMAKMEPWEEDEDLREAVVELLARHLLAEVGGEFVRRVVEAKRN